MARGDHLKVPRWKGLIRYWHHGIEVEGRDVIHFVGDYKISDSAYIRRTSMSEFLKGEVYEVVHYKDCYPIDKTIRLAKMNIGQGGYDLTEKNCEHFATFCKTGEARSSQVEFVDNTIYLLDNIEEVINLLF